MTASMPMASTVSTVSRRLSPFLTDELATARESTSADSRLAAVSKESRVRVDSSKNRVATTLPRRVGTLGTERRSTSAKASATRRTSAMPSAPEVGHREQVRRAGHLSSRVPIQTPSSPTSTISSRRVGRFLPTKSGRMGSSRWPRSTMTASWTARARPKSFRALSAARMVRPGEEDVVDQHDHPAGQVDRDVGHRLGQDGAQADVVAVEGHVEAADVEAVGALDLAQHLGHLRGQGDPAGLEADQDDVVDAAVALDDLVRHARQGALDVGGGQDLGVGHEHAPEGSRMTALAFGHCSSCRVSLTGLTSRSGAQPSARPDGAAPGAGCGRASAVRSGRAPRRRSSTGCR